MSDGLEPETGQNKRRRHTGKIEQAGHLWSWERSGLSGGEYARLHGLKARDLYRWRKLGGTARRNGLADKTVDPVAVGS